MPHTICIYTLHEKWEKPGIPQKSRPVSEIGAELIANYFHFILSPQRFHPSASHALSLFLQAIPSHYTDYTILAFNYSVQPL